jgi:hypothetical protein
VQPIEQIIKLGLAGYPSEHVSKAECEGVNGFWRRIILNNSDFCCNLAITALITNKDKMNHFNSRRRGGILASAAKLLLVLQHLQ